MLIIPNPDPAALCGPGWVAFTANLSHPIGLGIALATAREQWMMGALVATHVGTVIEAEGSLVVAEALGQGYVLTPLDKFCGNPRDRQRVVWFRRPQGLTPAAGDFMSLMAAAWAGAGIGYDTGALPGFLIEPGRIRAGLRNRLEDPDELFCSEAAAELIQRSAGVMAPEPPPEFMAVHPSSVSPHRLDQWPGLWWHA